jgi:hypothetical protein
MDINAVYPSRFVKAADLQGRTIRARISHVDLEDVSGDGEQKPVLYLAGKVKGLVLNRTNGQALAAELGPETEKWAGAEIELFPMKVSFQGRLTDAVRIRALKSEPGKLPDEDIGF